MLSEPLPYHVKIRDYFKGQPGIWSFFAAAPKREEQLTAFKTELLKNTYQFNGGSDPLLYEKIQAAREKLGLGGLAVTAYQAITHEPELNASIVCLAGEAHIVFSGGLLQILDERELLALIAHELAHVKFNSLLDGELEITDRIIMAIANSPDSEAAQYETARLFRLYTEIYCDRAACGVLGDPTPVITMLLKMATGLSVVHADSYIRQAEAIFAGGPGVQSASLTHPENFIRTRALQLWGDIERNGTLSQQGDTADNEPSASGGTNTSVHSGKAGPDPVIAQMIEGVMDLDRLDVLAQKNLAGLTEGLVVYYLRPKWFRSAPVVSLARQYFADLSPDAEGDIEKLKAFLVGAHASIREYFAYVLLDFALADPDLEDVPAGYALRLAGDLGLLEVFEPVMKKELSYTDKQWERQRQQMIAAYDTLKEV
ncbi:M48 family metalloprotease [Flavitalea sp. BT771]|uniref:M48 family metalloprotease n=1 Tax=Flavitalea sp. BT771 TaxID=3063329 RepID=UPI0026E1DA3B|nr:M48 family metalloprotease [Flavitalea sp. BT771]MDO6433416.1 M48 family metalloprotease [Flavitalea sp. BT771]MDV6222679.1 M48 family metalloprotease [Flavitalea sp. BT771]